MTFNFGNSQPQQSMFGNGLEYINTDIQMPGVQMPGTQPPPPAFGKGSTTGQNIMGGVQAFTGLANAYMGYKNYGLAKDQLDENKKQFNLNFNSQAGLVNNQIADQYALRADSAKTNGMNFGTQEQYLADRGVRGADGKVVGG